MKLGQGSSHSKLSVLRDFWLFHGSINLNKNISFNCRQLAATVLMLRENSNPDLSSHIKTPQGWVLISSEYGEYIRVEELALRRALTFAYRFCLSVFLSVQVFDLMFSSLWMHGYIW